MKWSYIIILQCTVLLISSQNLVPNPGFENYSSCPTDYTHPWFPGKPFEEFENAIPWVRGSGGSPDYFNACNNTLEVTTKGNVGVPSNLFGHQEAHSGNAYAGFYASIGIVNEYIQVPLTAPLIKGKKYSVEFFLSLAETHFSNPGYNKFGGNDAVGARFTTKPIFSPTYWHSVAPHVDLPFGEVMKDTLSWERFCDDFTADSAYQYITIGIIGNSIGRQTAIVYDETAPGSTIPGITYYYIDDVAVIPFDDPTSGRDSSICSGDSIPLYGTGGVSYSWQPAESFANPSISNPIVAPKTTTSYTTSITYTSTCTNYIYQKVVNIEVNNCDPPSLFIPNSFTPNNDGLNDVFNIYGNKIDRFEILIYNRWGELIFKTNNLDKGWDGMVNGEEATEGIYLYDLQYMLQNNQLKQEFRNVLLVR